MKLSRKLAASAALGALALALSAPAAMAQQTTAAVRGVAVDDNSNGNIESETVIRRI